MAEVWLDLAQAAMLLAIPAPRFARLIADGVIATHRSPGGTPGVLKAELLAWHRADRAARRNALAAFAAQVDREIFR